MARPTTHVAQQLTIHLNTHDHAHHHSLLIELVQRARRTKMAGGTVFEAVEGYGSSGMTQRHHLVGGSAPLQIVIVDNPERINRFLAELGTLLDHVLVTVHDVEVVER